MLALVTFFPKIDYFIPPLMLHYLLLLSIALLLTTNDMLSQWVSQPMPPIGRVVEASFVSAKNGVALGIDLGNPVVITTLDSTRTWTKWALTSNAQNAYALRSISLSESGVGWTVGPAGVFRTTDFGVTWENDSLALPAEFQPSSAVVVWSVIETSKDWAYIAGCQAGSLALCARHLNQDSIWRVVTLPEEINCGDDVPWEPTQSQVKGTMSPDGVGFVAVASDTFITSVNPPFDWTIRSQIQSSIPGYDVRDVMFVDSLNGWMSGDMAFSNDGGRTWVETVASPSVCSTICFVDTTCGWVADGLDVRMTRNGGRSWERQLPIQRIFALEIVDGDKVYAMGATFWIANIRSLCDSTASSVRDVDVNHVDARSFVIGSTLTIDLAGHEIADQVSVHVSDLLGRSVASWVAQDVPATNQLILDFPKVECGVYLISVYSGSNISGSMITYCN